MPPRKLLPMALALTVAFVSIIGGPLGANAAVDAEMAPEFTQTDSGAWINGPPLRMRQLRGKVLMLDVWTFECWNCYRSFPWLQQLEDRYERAGLQVIGIHSPEFERERKRAAVLTKVEEFGIEHPVMIDNDFGYWKALGNRVWPTFYLIDKHGRIRYRFIGETRIGEPQALRIERAVEKLLSEHP